MYKLVIFDLDGTLMDTSEGILKSIVDTIEQFSLPKINSDILKSFIGPPIQESLQNTFHLEKDILYEATDYFRNIYSQKYLYFAEPYDGIYELLRLINKLGITIGIATYKREDYALQLLERFHFNVFTDNIFGADNFNVLKKKDIIMKCIKKALVSNINEVLMIGDTDHDAIAANEIGTDFLAVKYGFGFKTAEDVMEYSNVGYVNSVEELRRYFM
jgi:phosphoglycolate phosphatase